VRYAGTDRRRIGWDALDQVDDNPRRDEEVYVYVLMEEPTRYHLLIRGKGKREGGWYQDGKYKHLPEKPEDHVLRDNERWRRWTLDNYDWLAPDWWKARNKPKTPPAGDPHVGSTEANAQSSAAPDYGPPAGGSRQ
jgi:hypothetical protein